MGNLCFYKHFTHRAAKIDHSCTPNAEYVFVGKTIKVIACDAVPNVADVSSLHLHRKAYGLWSIQFVLLFTDTDAVRGFTNADKKTPG